MTPSRLGLRLAALWAVIGMGAAVRGELLWVWGGGGALLFLALALDLGRGLRPVPIRVERRIPSSVAVGVATRAELRIVNTSTAAVRVIAREAEPESFRIEALPREVRIRPGGSCVVPYSVRPRARGHFTLQPVPCRVASPFGLWWRDITAADRQAVRVYPNFRAVARYALLATDDRTSEVGIRKRQRRGEGTEFHQLREYRQGDSLRQIDWRATSRMMKVISREYRDERDQQLFFVLDCSRRMHARDGELVHLDHALDAVLLLAHVALRQGDAVGLMTFGGPKRRLPPRKGTGYLTEVLNSVYDLTTTTAASDLCGALENAVTSLRRRSLIVLVSNLRDEEEPDLVSMARVANRRHLVLLASLRERVLGEALGRPPRDFDAALGFAAAHDFLRARAEAHDRLMSSGLLVLDVEPRQLAASLVNRYLEIKAGGAL